MTTDSVVQLALPAGFEALNTKLATVGTQLSIQILGERKQATVIAESPYDPENNELRA